MHANRSQHNLFIRPPGANRSADWFTHCLLPVLLTAFLLLAVHVNRLPAHLIADDVISGTVATILQQADDAMAQKLWHEAKDDLEQALLQSDPTAHESIRKRLQWCHANTSLEQRYGDQSVAQHIRAVEPARAKTILTQTLQLIDENYYEEFDVKEILEKALLQLQAVTENPFVYHQFAVDDRVLTPLQERIKSLLRDLPASDPCRPITSLTIAQSLCDLSEKAGLGASWPALELAYAFADSLDPYSYLLSPHQCSVMYDQLEGHYVGTGLDLIFTDQFPLVFDVVPDSPAQKCGIVPGDILIEADGVDCRAKTPEQIGKLLIGQAQTKVTVTIKRDDKEKPLSMTITRRLINAPSVRYVKLLEPTIGFFRVVSFDQDTALEMQHAVDDLKSRGAKSLVIDLRSNGGGIMSSAIDAVRLFIDRGTIVTVCTSNEKTRYVAGGDGFSSGTKTKHGAATGLACYKIPLVLLVDEKTASSSEIFTAALQDHNRAVVVGTNTLGKNVVQTIFNLKPTAAALCITTARYLPPSEKDFHQYGLVPDILVENDLLGTEINASMKTYLAPENPTLKEAIKQVKLL
jgi:C-terminal peptidase prc